VAHWPGSATQTSERSLRKVSQDCTHVHVHMHMHARSLARTHTHTHTHIHTHTHARTHAHTSELVLEESEDAVRV
jgi:hypothetical protein